MAYHKEAKEAAHCLAEAAFHQSLDKVSMKDSSIFIRDYLFELVKV
jgi:hypothetical protein